MLVDSPHLPVNKFVERPAPPSAASGILPLDVKKQQWLFPFQTPSNVLAGAVVGQPLKARPPKHIPWGIGGLEDGAEDPLEKSLKPRGEEVRD